MFVVTYRKLFYGISALLVLISIVSISVWGLNFGIDFKGGTIIEVEYQGARPSQDQVTKQISDIGIAGVSVRQAGDSSYIIRSQEISEVQRPQVLAALSANGTYKYDEKRFDSVGPLLGKEARNKSVAAIIAVLIIIVLFIAFAFRKVSEPISSWKYGLVAIVALVHDIIVPTGAFAILGHFKGFEVDTLFITALLVVLGFSIHDTIVVFDRVRENLKHRSGKTSFTEVVGNSISQTFTRSINTSLTVVLSLLVLYFVGSEATHHFIMALLIGIIAGTYSSIFLGSPLLVTLESWQNRKNRR